MYVGSTSVLTLLLVDPGMAADARVISPNAAVEPDWASATVVGNQASYPFTPLVGGVNVVNWRYRPDSSTGPFSYTSYDRFVTWTSIEDDVSERLGTVVPVTDSGLSSVLKTLYLTLQSRIPTLTAYEALPQAWRSIVDQALGYFASADLRVQQSILISQTAGGGLKRIKKGNTEFEYATASTKAIALTRESPVDLWRRLGWDLLSTIPELSGYVTVLQGGSSDLLPTRGLYTTRYSQAQPAARPVASPTVGLIIEGGAKSYRHVQDTPSSTWRVYHNLGRYPSVSVIDSSGSVVHGDVDHQSECCCVLSFCGEFGGEAYCV